VVTKKRPSRRVKVEAMPPSLNTAPPKSPSTVSAAAPCIARRWCEVRHARACSA